MQIKKLWKQLYVDNRILYIVIVYNFKIVIKICKHYKIMNNDNLYT